MSEVSNGYELSLQHVEEISKNARSTWFALLGVLAFASLAVANVQDSDFFAFGVKTTLPLVNVDVPTVPFFWTAPVITFAIYAYLHLYLTNLWRSLGTLPQVIDRKGERVLIEDAVYPWIMSDAALYLRKGSDKRFLSWLKITIVIALFWMAGPAVLAFFWVRSWPYHEEWLSLFCSLMMLLSIFLGTVTAANAIIHLRRGAENKFLEHHWKTFWVALAIFYFLVVGGAVLVVSWNRTEGPLANVTIASLYRADLRGAELIPKPSQWRPWYVAMDEYLTKYSGMDMVDIADQLDQIDDGNRAADWVWAAKQEFLENRRALIGSPRRTNLTGADLRGADLSGAYISGVDLSNARIAGANFTDAELEGAKLEGIVGFDNDCTVITNIFGQNAHDNCVTFVSANLAMSTIHSDHLPQSDFQFANLSFSKMFGNFGTSSFSFSDFEGAKVGGVLDGSFFFSTKMVGVQTTASFSDAVFAGVDLRNAKFVAEEWHAEFEPEMAVLDNVSFISSNLRNVSFPETNSIAGFRGSYLGGVNWYYGHVALDTLIDANLSDLDLSDVDIDNGGFFYALANSRTILPPMDPPIYLLKCFSGVAPESFQIYGTSLLEIAPSLFTVDQFCSDGAWGEVPFENLVIGPRLNPHIK